MAKAFTYSRLPEHQVAIYYDGGDRTGEIISAVAVVLEPNRSFRFTVFFFNKFCFIFQAIDPDHQSGVSWSVSSRYLPLFYFF